MRTFKFLCAIAVLALSGTGAGAQTVPASSEYASCPRGRLSIYFASGDTTASPQALVLIDRVSETASSCHADGIDLVARVDTRVDGENAMSLALARLNAVSADLVAKGVPVERIRVAAQAAKGPSAPLIQIDVLFRKTSETVDDVAGPPPAPERVAPSQAI